MGRPKKDKGDAVNSVIAKLDKLDFAPQLELESKVVDPFLNKIIVVTYFSLIDLKKIKFTNLTIEENRYNDKFLYFVENKKRNLSGYIGRDKITNEVIFLAVDERRFYWAEQEGFIQNSMDAHDRQIVFDKIGVLIHLNGLNSFINYIAGDSNYEFAGEYILVGDK